MEGDVDPQENETVLTKHERTLNAQNDRNPYTRGIPRGRRHVCDGAVRRRWRRLGRFVRRLRRRFDVGWYDGRLDVGRDHGRQHDDARDDRRQHDHTGDRFAGSDAGFVDARRWHDGHALGAEYGTCLSRHAADAQPAGFADDRPPAVAEIETQTAEARTVRASRFMGTLLRDASLYRREVPRLRWCRRVAGRRSPSSKGSARCCGSRADPPSR
jgi:hypothetical protein